MNNAQSSEPEPLTIERDKLDDDVRQAIDTHGKNPSTVALALSIQSVRKLHAIETHLAELTTILTQWVNQSQGTTPSP